jgi:cytochrome oxidase Cu insertion factor (SCO1/SenC/PrrC family)
MPGMGTGLNENDPTIVSAFHAALLRQFLVVLLILFLVAVAWNVLRGLQLRRAAAAGRAGGRNGPDGTAGPRGTGGEGGPVAGQPNVPAFQEPVARRLLRVSFGLLWIFDGILQGQSAMPLGMAPQVIAPAAAVSPGWVQRLDNEMATIWSYHPIAAPAAAVWIQIGIGVWLLAAARGDLSRLAGLASVAWGLVVWIFGEAFGQVFAPGLSWLFGAPGAVLFYCLAGVLVALPLSMWATPRLGRLVTRAAGVFFVGMALLQAWPGRGFWQGKGHTAGTAGTLTAMVQEMARTPQPHLLSSWLTAFASLDAAHGWAVNLVVVLVMASIGVAFLTGEPRLVRWGVAGAVVFCLADWVLVEDLGFLGGVGTDPNSMVPMVLVVLAGYLALTRVPAPATVSAVRTFRGPAPLPAGTVAPGSGPAGGGGRRWWDEVSADPAYAFRSIAAIGAVGIALVGVVPMMLAMTSAQADPILADAIDGTPNATDTPAPAFNLVDQQDRPISLGALRGKVIALTFLDPVCTSDCPVIAQEFRAADSILGAAGRSTELVAIDANPRYTSPAYLMAFDRQEGMDRLGNWLYLTGSLAQLEHVWDVFGVQVAYEPAGAMIGHSEVAYVIDARGRTRFILDTDPGPGTEATKSSFSVTLATALETALHLGRS